MKKTIFILTLVCLLIFPYKAYAADYEADIRDIADEYNISYESISDITISDVFDYILTSVKEKSVQPLKIALRLAGIIILCAIIKTFGNENNAAANAALDNVCTLIIFVNLLTPVGEVIDIVTENLFSVKNFMTTFLPVFAGISMASGEFVTSAIYTGFFLTALIFISNFCLNVILPSVQMYFALIISNALSTFVRLKSISDFYTKAVKWLMKTLVSVICFILTVQTTISQGKDTLAVKAGKFVAGAAIPVIGSTLQDAVGSVYAGMEAIKGFAGAVGLIGTVMIFIPSLVSLAVYWLCTNCLFIISDIFDAKSIGLCVKGFTDIIELMISVVFLYMIMLIFSLTIMISITNGV